MLWQITYQALCLLLSRRANIFLRAWRVFLIEQSSAVVVNVARATAIARRFGVIRHVGVRLKGIGVDSGVTAGVWGCGCESNSLMHIGRFGVPKRHSLLEAF